MNTFEAIILAIVEGLTEYLPVSSTGHIIIASSLMGINQDPFTKDFTVIVQFGAILSVLVLYWRRFIDSWRTYERLLIGFFPVAIVGLALKKTIDSWLGNVAVVAFALIVGGVVLLFVDRWFAKQEERLSQSGGGGIDRMTRGNAFFIGLIQCIALVPGVSRSAATIIGGLTQSLTRKDAAEFSFLLAVPTLSAATAYKLYKILPTIEREQISIILIGNLVSFVVGFVTIKAFLGFLTRRGFFAFGVYRIAVGLIILILLATGHGLAVI